MSHLNCKTETLSAQKYDVFISYSHKDEARYITKYQMSCINEQLQDWVEGVLWPRLEADLGYRWVTVDM